VEIPNNKSQRTSKYQLTKFQRIKQKVILKKGKRIEKDIFINTGKIKIV
jgi:hypothetical protein